MPGQLTLPGMPAYPESEAGQPTLPGLEGFGILADPAVPGDPELAAVATELSALDPDGSRMAGAIRDALDMLLDGQHTGRYRWDQLHKTEKTHAGTLVEIALARTLHLADGQGLDYTIAGADVDCKFSHRMGGWMSRPRPTASCSSWSRPATRTAPGRPAWSAPPRSTSAPRATGTVSGPLTNAAAPRCAGCTPARRCRRTR